MNLLKYYTKFLFKPLIYRFPPIMIQPERLMLWQQTLIATEEVDGEVVEIGCYLGGTAAVSKKMMGNLGNHKPYRVYDTFAGFVAGQWKADYGTTSRTGDFSSNSTALTRWVLDRHGGKDVAIHKGDIATLPDHELPKAISACLLDVDLGDPIYIGLTRIFPLLQPGGTVLVDDCIEGDWYKARVGYERFMKELGRSPIYKFGMGILTK